jgi:hypothetical protein
MRERARERERERERESERARERESERARERSRPGNHLRHLENTFYREHILSIPTHAVENTFHTHTFYREHILSIPVLNTELGIESKAPTHRGHCSGLTLLSGKRAHTTQGLHLCVWLSVVNCG